MTFYSFWQKNKLGQKYKHINLRNLSMFKNKRNEILNVDEPVSNRM